MLPVQTRPHQMLDGHLLWKPNYWQGLMQPRPGALVFHGLVGKVSLGPGLRSGRCHYPAPAACLTPPILSSFLGDPTLGTRTFTDHGPHVHH